MFMKLIQGGRTDTLQLTARQGRLEHIRGIHRALSRARPHYGMQLIDEEDNFPFGALHLLDGRFQPFFKLAAKAAAGNHSAQVQRNHPFADQNLRDIVGGNFLC